MTSSQTKIPLNSLLSVPIFTKAFPQENLCESSADTYDLEDQHCCLLPSLYFLFGRCRKVFKEIVGEKTKRVVHMHEERGEGHRALRAC